MMFLRILASLQLLLSSSAQATVYLNFAGEETTAWEKVTFLDETRATLPTLAELQDGPQIVPGIAHGKDVYCRYFAMPKKGTNPKFMCHHTDQFGHFLNKNGEITTNENEYVELRIKYVRTKHPNPRKDRDPYTEVFASNFLWSLGYAVDRNVRPRKLICSDCPEDPWDAPHGPKGTITFDQTMIKIHYPGETILRPGNVFGWSFIELNRHPQIAGTKKTQFEGLALLMTLLVHSSNLREQQRFVSTDGLLRTVALVNDLGSILGDQRTGQALGDGFRAKSHGKGNFLSWSERKIWLNPHKCTLNLFFHHNSWLKRDHLSISEEGRKFIAARLHDVIENDSGKKLKTLLEKSGLVMGDQGLKEMYPKATEADLIEHWYRAFAQKFMEIRSTVCPEA